MSSSTVNPDHVMDVMEFSTAHATQEDMAMLIEECQPRKYCAGGNEYGAWVWTGAHKQPEFFGELRDAGASIELLAALRKANTSGCRYARFDRDGPVHDDIPTNDW